MIKNTQSDRVVTYVLAVSGGVDSVALLHIMATRSNNPAIRLIVAHFDHGIRPDAADDRRFVADLAKRYGLQFVYDEGRLGAGASEAVARNARYAFLRKVRQSSNALVIVTAHHEDDVLETAILNLLRGTGRKGLSSLRSTDEIYRPLLRTPKAHIHAYARKHDLEWREDSTNEDDAYLRNYVRLRILPRFDETARQQLRILVRTAHDRNVEIDGLLAQQLWSQLGQLGSDRIDRRWFIMLPHIVAREIVAAWLRSLGMNQFDKQLLERIAVAIKTLQAGKQLDISRRYVLTIHKDEAVISVRRS